MEYPDTATYNNRDLQPMSAHEEEPTGSEPIKHIQNPTKIHVIRLRNYAFRYMKELASYDTTMPRGLNEKICDANVMSDVLVTPAVKAYLIEKLEAEKQNITYHLHLKSIEKALLFLYSVE
jgi:hypothetical protein